MAYSRRGGRASAFAVWLSAACAGLSCGSPAPSSGHAVTRVVIGAAMGGTAAIPGGHFKVQIPPFALKQDTAITIQQIDPPVPGNLGPVYEVGPTGTLFQHPVTLTFSFAGVQLGGADSTTLHVATYSGGAWVPVTSAVDSGSSLVTGQITHLSPWTLIVYTSSVLPPEPEAGTGGDMDGGGDANDDGAAGAAGASAGADGGARDATGGAGAGGAAGGKAGAGGAGTSGAAGSAGTSGGAGTSGAAGSAGTAGTSGGAGTSGAAGASGQAGQGGTGGADADAATDTDPGDGGADTSDADPDATD